MRISTFWYCLKQGVNNICRNILFSLASIATISACIFLFCLFFSIVVNVQYVVKNTESTVGITVFFNEGTTDETIAQFGETLKARPEVKEIKFKSAEEAWEEIKGDYFGEDKMDLAEGFRDDNPLANSASYDIFLNDLENQEEFVTWLKSQDIIRRVNYSSTAAEGITSINKVIGVLSVMIIGVLLAVAIFLISNTVTMGITIRREEIAIMKYIGAKDFFVRAPFIVEGIFIGLIGAAVPLVALYFAYGKVVNYVLERFKILNNILDFLRLHLLHS